VPIRSRARKFISHHAWSIVLAVIGVLGTCACQPTRPGDDVVVNVGLPPPKEKPTGPPPSHAVRNRDPGKPMETPRFDWPPPNASAQETIPDKWLRKGNFTTLANVADLLQKALELAEYSQLSYYAAPRGFALATHLEQIAADGTPLPGADRWKIGTPSVANLSLLDFITALAHAPAGHYRAIVFIVTDAAWTQSAAAPGEAQIERWATGGVTALPEAIGAMPFSDGHRATALIYQFRKRGQEEAKFVAPSPLSAYAHLERGRLWKFLSSL